MQKQDMIYEDFMEDRAIKMFKDDELNYSVYVQVFTTDNLPFSPITGDKKHFVNAYKATPQIPSTSSWGVFLRVHDELSLEMVDKETREIVYNALINKGAEF